MAAVLLFSGAVLTFKGAGSKRGGEERRAGTGEYAWGYHRLEKLKRPPGCLKNLGVALEDAQWRRL
eukprot:3791743-Rhodomonas_salina.2